MFNHLYFVQDNSNYVILNKKKYIIKKKIVLIQEDVFMIRKFEVQNVTC